MTVHDTSDRYLEIDEVAELLSVHPATVRAWCRAGQIPAIRLPSKWVISEQALTEWLDRGGLVTSAAR